MPFFCGSCLQAAAPADVTSHAVGGQAWLSPAVICSCSETGVTCISNQNVIILIIVFPYSYFKPKHHTGLLDDVETSSKEVLTKWGASSFHVRIGVWIPAGTVMEMGKQMTFQALPSALWPPAVWRASVDVHIQKPREILIIPICFSFFLF